MTTKEVLGYTGKYFAVWTVSISEEEVCPGCTRKFTRYTYIRKASKYLNIAQNKYPGLQVDPSLADKTKGFWTKEYIWTSNDVFRFGKYRGQIINDCTDTDYIAWYWKNIYDEHKAHVEKILISRGYTTGTKTVTDESNIFSIKVREMISGDVAALENRDIDSMSEELRKIYTAKELTIKPTHNITMNGNYLEGGVIYRFLNFKKYPATYYAPEYYLPLSNGKAKRIKDKNVLIDQFNVKMDNNKIIVEVLNFKIV